MQFRQVNFKTTNHRKPYKQLIQCSQQTCNIAQIINTIAKVHKMTYKLHMCSLQHSLLSKFGSGI